MNKINQMTSEGMSLQRAYLMACEDDRQQWWNSKSTNHKQRAEALGWLQPEQMPLKMWELLTIGNLGGACFRYNKNEANCGGAKSQLGVRLGKYSGDLLSFVSDKPGVPSFEKFCEGMWTAAQEYYYTDADQIQGSDAIDVRNDFIELLSYYIGSKGGARRNALDAARKMYEETVIAPMEQEADEMNYLTDEEIIFNEQMEQETESVKQAGVTEYINNLNPIESQMIKEENKGKKFRSVLAMTTSGKQFIIGLPRRMSAAAANKYVQYLRTMFDFIPLQIREQGWSGKAAAALQAA